MGVAFRPNSKQQRWHHQQEQGSRIVQGAACPLLKENSRPEGPRSAPEAAPSKRKDKPEQRWLVVPPRTAGIPQESRGDDDDQQCEAGEISATIPQNFKQEAKVRGVVAAAAAPRDEAEQRFRHARAKNSNAAHEATDIHQSSSRFSDVNPALIPTLDALDSACASRMAWKKLFQRTKRHLAEIDKALEAFEPEVKIEGPFHGHHNWRIQCQHQHQYQHRTNRKRWKKFQLASLKSVWKWYEDPSVCGAKVACGDRSDDRFDAYFVPYLSAVQLFGPSNDAPLLFEFFEVDQPPNRLPLYQRILQLVRDKINGGSAALDRSFEELHPASWYAVSWYPIYKIPDGPLSCAFLTYHCPAHLLRNSQSLSLPALGLQTYKCQAEQWFRLKQEHEALPFAVDTLQQHLANLCAGAEAMSRKCANRRHSDYEFFTNRRF